MLFRSPLVVGDLSRPLCDDDESSSESDAGLEMKKIFLDAIEGLLADRIAEGGGLAARLAAGPGAGVGGGAIEPWRGWLSNGRVSNPLTKLLGSNDVPLLKVRCS